MSHTTYVSGDTVVANIQGTLELAILEEMFARIEQHILPSYPSYFALVDASQLSGVSAAVRKRGTEWAHMKRGAGNVVYGAGIVPRTLLTMLARAMTLFGRHPVPLIFVATEQDGWAWIARRRQELGLPEPKKP